MEFMAAKIRAPRRLRWSGTAWSPPRHFEARRHAVRHRAARAELRRRLADDLAERPAERGEAGEADVEADLADRVLRRAQEAHRALDAPPLQVPVRRLAERVLERADEVRLGHVGDAGQRRD